MYDYFKSVLDQDRAAVVICNLEHEIIYMNPAAVAAYEKWGGSRLMGKNLLHCHNDESKESIRKVLAWFVASSGTPIFNGAFSWDPPAKSEIAIKEIAKE